MSTPIHVVSFASEGPPHDDGIPLGQATLDEWGDLCLAGGATTYKGYTPRSLVGSEWSVKHWPDEHVMIHNHGYHTVGLGAWRAVIFNKAMQAASDGDIVIVHCTDFNKIQNMGRFAENLRAYTNVVMLMTDLYAPPHDTVGSYSSADVFNLIQDPGMREVVARAPMGRCLLIIARVSNQTRRFAQLFEETVKTQPLLLSPLGKTGYPGVPYSHHTAEQAVFNVLAFREGLFPKKWHRTWMSELRQVGLEPGMGVDIILAYHPRPPRPQLSSSSVPIHVVSFGSEGQPHDEGLAIGESVLEEWGDLCLDGGATTYRGYTPRSIIAENPKHAWCVKRWPDEHFIGHNPGYHAVGLGAWRAVIFNKAVQAASDGDIVVVHCSNFPRHPCMTRFAANLRDYVETVMSLTDFYAPPHYYVGRFCTSDVLNRLIPDSETREVVARAPMGRCRLIVARVNSTTRRFAELYEETLRTEPLLLSGFCKSGLPGVLYTHSTAEQAVFNVLAFREGLFPKEWKGSWMTQFEDAGVLPGMGVDMVLAHREKLNRD